jgi:hypothetical protein
MDNKISDKGMAIIKYATDISRIDDQQLFDECMDNLYPGVKLGTRKGSLVHELMDRLNHKSN